MSFGVILSLHIGALGQGSSTQHELEKLFGQCRAALDECDLTLKDLHKIAESFVRVLTGVFHTRLEYPEVKIKKEKKNAPKNKGKQPK